MSLHGMIEAQVRATPDAVALRDSTGQLSYRQLDLAANRLAHRLRGAGVGPEIAVAVLAERRLDTVVAILGVLKAGGAYVPIDPTVPTRRFSYLMADSGARFLITDPTRRPALPDGDWSLVELNRVDDHDDPAEPPTVAVHPDAAAYVIYTSGSTGEPKGVVVSHRQIVSSTLAHQSFGRPTPAGFLLLISFAFDAVACGLYWTLATGGCVVIPDQDQMRDPVELRRLIAEHRITHTDCTPALYTALLGDDPTGLDSLRCAIVGGEACPTDLVERHARLLPGVTLVNNYGPTENAVFATTADLVPEGSDQAVPIGRPVPATRAHVGDGRLEPVPDGDVGELLLGGGQVARGYHGRPGLTADRFRPDPWSAVPGGRLYRTGDHVHTRPDGQLVFRGRADHQVKVRGFRVELGEVERALAAHPAVAEAVCDVRTLGAAAALVGWVRLHGADADLDEVRAEAARWLPAHMVPTRIEPVDTVPRTVSGKVDRSALPTPAEPAVGEPSRPLTPLEADVAAMVCEVLGRSGIDPDTDLFDAGATSLHVTQLALLLWTRFDNIRLHDLFQQPTVAGIARIVEARRTDGDDEDLRPWDLPRPASEAVLDPTIQAAGLPRGDWAQPGAVLVTGATGYLGAFLVHELLERTTATIWCLVRADDDAHAGQRLRETMSRYLIWDDRHAGRLRVAVGDLEQPRLGLAPETYDELSRTVDAVYHSGALVNFIYPYEAMKAANVAGTAEILRLATTRRLKAVHFVSTIDVFLQTDIARPFYEDMELVPLDVPAGYPRSKWVAEHLVRIGRDRGIPCSVYRPGMMISHTATGATQTIDFLLIQIKGLMEFGIIPEADFMFDAVPIDYAAGAIAHISLRPEVLGRTFHLWNPEPVHVSDVHRWIRSFGYAMEQVPPEQAVQHLLTLDTSNPMFRMLPLMLDEYAGRPPTAFEPSVVADVDIRAELRNTEAALAGSGLHCPPMTEELAHRCFQYLVDTGFFPNPDEQRDRLRRTEAPAAAGTA